MLNIIYVKKHAVPAEILIGQREKQKAKGTKEDPIIVDVGPDRCDVYEVVDGQEIFLFERNGKRYRYKLNAEKTAYEFWTAEEIPPLPVSEGDTSPSDQINIEPNPADD